MKDSKAHKVIIGTKLLSRPCDVQGERKGERGIGGGRRAGVKRKGEKEEEEAEEVGF